MALVLGLSVSLSAVAEDFATTKQLAETGDFKAQYKMGILYETGTSVEQDYAKAFNLSLIHI